jgi:hypothetical protein
MTNTRALVGPQRHEITCAVEVAALKDVKGSGELVRFAANLSRDRNINGILHWGQRNDSTMADIQFRFGDRPGSFSGPLNTWRRQLARITENGRLDGFSSAFTKRVGLEVVQPLIDTLAARVEGTGTERTITVVLDCHRNPSDVVLRIDIINPAGQPSRLGPLSPQGENSFPASTGSYTLTLIATIILNGEARSASETTTILVA